MTSRRMVIQNIGLNLRMLFYRTCTACDKNCNPTSGCQAQGPAGCDKACNHGYVLRARTAGLPKSCQRESIVIQSLAIWPSSSIIRLQETISVFKWMATDTDRIALPVDKLLKVLFLVWIEYRTLRNNTIKRTIEVPNIKSKTEQWMSPWSDCLL